MEWFPKRPINHVTNIYRSCHIVSLKEIVDREQEKERFVGILKYKRFVENLLKNLYSSLLSAYVKIIEFFVKNSIILS